MGKSGRKSKRAQRALNKNVVGASDTGADGWRDGGRAAETAALEDEVELRRLEARARAAAAAHAREQGDGRRAAAERQAQAAAALQSEALLGDEAAVAGADEVSTTVLAPRKKRAPGSNASKSRPAAARPLSKSEKRKLAKLEREKALRGQRAAAFAAMQRAALPAEALALLRPSAELGKRGTRREEARRGLAMERAGVAVAAEGQEAPHLKRRRVAEPSEDDGDGGMDGGSGDESGDEGQAALAAAAAAAEAAAFEAVQAAPDADALVLPPLTADVDPDADEWDGEGGSGEFDVPTFLAERARRDAEEAAAEGPRAGVVLRDPSIVPKKAHHRTMTRPADIDESRKELPIMDMEQEIMEAINGNLVTVLCGATGSGKTTQLPQFLYEAGYGDPACADHPGAIAVTQPRRVAASSAARRVAQEMGMALGGEVGYQVRYDRRCGESPAIKFMTDGLLLKEVESDLLLEKYSIVLIDEAHERTLGTDVLLGLLSRAVPLRARLAAEGAPHPVTGRHLTPLRLVVMSATLRVEDFAANAALFPRAPPVLRVPARQFPVSVHFARRTEMGDYVREAARTVSKIHRRLPPGGILVFLTGRAEVERCAQLVNKEFKRKRGRSKAEAEGEEKSKQAAADLVAREEKAVPSAAGGGKGGGAPLLRDDDAFAAEDADDVWGDGGEGDDDYDAAADDDDDDEFLGEDLLREAKELREQAQAEGGEAGDDGVHVLPLFAQLPPTAQLRVFQPPPEGSRLVVVATNVAETSLTIPGIRYVVDCGRHKERVYSRGGVSKFEVGWVSRASAEQRAGRAGRTGPGHVYRLYSSALCQDLAEHFPPAITTTPVDGMALQLRAMGVDRVENFPFATPPPPGALAEAHATLLAVGALRRPDGAAATVAARASSASGAVLTKEGRRMAALPLSPRVARCLLVALREGGAAAAAHALRLAAVLSHESPFLREVAAAKPAGEDAAKAAKAARRAARAKQAAFVRDGGEAVSAAAALAAYEAAVGAASRGAREAWCAERALRPTVLAEAAALVEQLARGMARCADLPEGCREVAVAAGSQQAAEAAARAPDAHVLRALRRAACAGWADRVARRARADEGLGDSEESRRAAVAGKGVRYMTNADAAPVAFIHASSPLAKAGPEYVVFTGVMKGEKRARPDGVTLVEPRAHLDGVTPVEPAWLAELSPGLVTLGAPLADPPPHYHAARDEVCVWREAAYGARGWTLPRARRRMPDDAKARAVFSAELLAGSAAGALRSKTWDALAGAGGTALLTPPAALCRPAAMAAARCAALLDALRARRVRSRAELRAALKQDRGFLRRELAMWLPDDRRERLRAGWARIVGDAIKGGATG